MEAELSLRSATGCSFIRRKQSIPSAPPDVQLPRQLRIAASRGKLHEVRTLLANGALITKDTVSYSY